MIYIYNFQLIYVLWSKKRERERERTKGSVYRFAVTVMRWERITLLMTSKGMEPGYWVSGCSSIHTHTHMLSVYWWLQLIRLELMRQPQKI